MDTVRTSTETENIRKYQTEVTTKLKNTLEELNSRLDEIEEQINTAKNK